MNDIPFKFVALETQPISTDLTMCDGLFVKHCVFNEGAWIPQHSHETAHLSAIATGSVRVWKDGKCMGDFTAPSGIRIEALSEHLFLALEDGTTVLCIHRVDDGDEPHIHAEHQIVSA